MTFDSKNHHFISSQKKVSQREAFFLLIFQRVKTKNQFFALYCARLFVLLHLDYGNFRKYDTIKAGQLVASSIFE